MSDGAYTGEKISFRQLWRDNHGNFLLAFTGLILIIGGIILTLPKGRNSPPGMVVPTISGEEDAETVATSMEETVAGMPESEVSTLLISVTGAEGASGPMRLALYRSPTHFGNPELADAKTTVELQEGVARWEIKVPANLPVAISAFHDTNDNGELDKSLIGIPIEKYGFTRGARSQRGPPPFEDTAFIPQPGIVEVPLEIW